MDNIKYYKGFDDNLQCRGFQFEVGATYKHDGDVNVCKSGFHSCKNPWDVLRYYDIMSRFAYVEVGGKTVKHKEDSKVASAELTVKSELKLPEFIADCINYLKDICTSEISPSGNDSKLAASGNDSKLAASGDRSIAICAGIKSRVKGGPNCALALSRWVESEKRYRITVAYIGENGIKPDVWYELNDFGEFCESK